VKSILTLSLLIVTLNGLPAYADPILWYNGDPQGSNLINGIDTQSVPVSNVYDNFIVPLGQTWDVTGAFSNDFLSLNFSPTQAEWEIRSGVSAGNGGTLIASGTNAATSTTFANAFTIAVSGLNVSLSAGTYWLTVAPVGVLNTNEQSFVAATTGTNAIGLPAGNDGNAFWNSPFLSENFASTTSPALGFSPGSDFSMGVSGTVSAVPEPSAIILLGSVVLALAGLIRRRLA
jgi:hypothetical protein